jgi:hypothetical protein
MPGNYKYLNNLRAMRASLSEELSELVEYAFAGSTWLSLTTWRRELGPKVFDDFEANRVVPGSSSGRPEGARTSSYGRQNAMLNHPCVVILGVWLPSSLRRFEWIDDKIWQSANDPQEDSHLDYDLVIGSPGTRSGRATPERRKSSGQVPTLSKLSTGATTAFEQRDLLHRRPSPQ